MRLANRSYTQVKVEISEGLGGGSRQHWHLGVQPRAELHLALVRIYPPQNSAPDHLEMVLVSLGLHPILWALVPALPRVLVPRPRLGQN